MNLLVKFNEVTKIYNDKTVIDKFSYTLKSGEVLALLGPSGCGKTTILNMTAGITKKNAGEIELFTKDIGYVFQEPRLIPWKTVVENVLFVLKSGSKNERITKAMHSLEKVGLTEVAARYPKELSGGMKQRVSIARALVSSPRVILMDEPFSALDISLKRELQEDVISIIEEKDIGIVYVTHDSEEAVKLADRVLLIENSLCRVKQEITLDRDRNKRDMYYIQQMKNEIQQYLIGGKTHAQTV